MGKSVTARDIFHLKRCRLKNIRSANEALFADAGIRNVSQATRNTITGSIAKQKKPHVILGWTQNTEVGLHSSRSMWRPKSSIFGSHSSAGQGKWASWLEQGMRDSGYLRWHALATRAKGRVIMFWAGIMGNKIVAAITYCDFIRDDLCDWLDELPLCNLNKVFYMHGNAQHASTLPHAICRIKCCSSTRVKSIM